MARERAILTGFEPFAGRRNNPSEDAVNHFRDTIVGDLEVIGIVLPCCYRMAFETLWGAVEMAQPRFVLSLGLSSRVRGIRFETQAKNVMECDYPDNAGVKPPGEPIVPGGVPIYRTNVDNELLARQVLAAGIPSEISYDADSFVCNDTIYRAMDRITTGGLDLRFAFIHMPWTDRYVGQVPLDDRITLPEESVHHAIELTLTGMQEQLAT